MVIYPGMYILGYYPVTYINELTNNPLFMLPHVNTCDGYHVFHHVLWVITPYRPRSGDVTTGFTNVTIPDLVISNDTS